MLGSLGASTSLLTFKEICSGKNTVQLNALIPVCLFTISKKIKGGLPTSIHAAGQEVWVVHFHNPLIQNERLSSSVNV